MSEARNTWGNFAPPFSPQFITYDAEFIDNGSTIELVSIAMVSGDGREMYAISREFNPENLLQNKWMRDNVWPNLPIDRSHLQQGSGNGAGKWYPKNACRCMKSDAGEYQCTHGCGKLDKDHPDVRSRGQIRRLVSDFIMASHPKDRDVDRDNVQLWAWYGAYDHVVLAQLFGPMINLPNHIPMHTNDLKSEDARLGGVEVAKQKTGIHNALDDARYNLVRAKAIWAVHTEGNI